MSTSKKPAKNMDDTYAALQSLITKGRMDDVADPWYSDRFDVAYDDIYAGCTGLLAEILTDGSKK